MVELWDNAKGLVDGKVVDQMRTYLFSKARAFYRLLFTCFTCAGFSRSVLRNRDERVFKYI